MISRRSHCLANKNNFPMYHMVCIATKNALYEVVNTVCHAQHYDSHNLCRKPSRQHEWRKWTRDIRPCTVRAHSLHFAVAVPHDKPMRYVLAQIFEYYARFYFVIINTRQKRRQHHPMHSGCMPKPSPHRTSKAGKKCSASPKSI